jgi:hypothetical protein
MAGGALAVGAAAWLGAASAVHAVPTLQVGVPDGMGGYLDYADNLNNPTEEDTAVGEDGDSLAVAGAFGPNTLALGGAFDGGSDWSDFGFDPIFNGSGALLFAVVPDGTLGDGTLTINGAGPVYTAANFESGFVMPNPPGNHAPVQNGDYLFFDIGDFENFADAVPNFEDDGEANADGQVKTLTVSVTGYEWIHFDVFAIETRQTGPNRQYSLAGNPGSHDVTFKIEDDPNPNPNPDPIPEPMTAGLGLLSLVALAAACGRRTR